MKMDEKELIEKITREVMNKLEDNEKLRSQSSDATVGKERQSDLLPSDLAKFIDHTLLKPDATEEDIDKLCREAKEYKFYSVCVNSNWVTRCSRSLMGSGVKVCAVVGFPLGAMNSRAKGFEARQAIEDGANELDMVINVGALKSGNLKLVEEDIRWVKRVCGQRVKLKVIIETALLTDAEIVIASELVKKVKADFIKTSTGFSKHGATVPHVSLMRKIVGPGIGVKAAGGVRNYDDAIAMIKAGANRIGTSGGIDIVLGKDNVSEY